jgi:hypothetical protein
MEKVSLGVQIDWFYLVSKIHWKNCRIVIFFQFGNLEHRGVALVFSRLVKFSKCHEPKDEPPSGNLACPNLWNAQYEVQVCGV